MAKADLIGAADHIQSFGDLVEKERTSLSERRRAGVPAQGLIWLHDSLRSPPP